MKGNRSYRRICWLEIAAWVFGILIAVWAGTRMAHQDRTQQSTPARDGVSRESVSSSPWRDQSSAPAEGAARARVQATYGRLPLAFEQNRGQAPDDVFYLSRSQSTAVLLKASEAVLRWPVSPTTISRAVSTSKLALSSPAISKFAELRIRLVDSNPSPRVEGESLLTSTTNYLQGKDPRGWKIHLPNFAKIRMHEVYPGVDLVYYGSHQRLEYDFMMQPGARPESIQLSFAGETAAQNPLTLGLDETGTLLIRTEDGLIRQQRPEAFQVLEGARRAVPCEYRIAADNSVGFALGDYDTSLPLVIDPVLSYSVVGIGGSAIAVDSQGNAYVTGIANPAFAASKDAYQTSPGGGTCFNGPNQIACPDILVAKLNPAGTSLVYSTFLGGSGSDYSYGIAVDDSGNAYLTGSTNSRDFAVTPDAYQTQHSGEICGQAPLNIPCNNAFVTKLNAQGTGLVYSTYLHGNSGGRVGNGVAVSPAGEAFVTGDNDGKGFVSKLQPLGTGILYSVSGIGGSAIAIDANGSAFVTGRNGTDSYVTKLSPDSTHVDYSYRLGGTYIPYSATPEEVEALTGIALDKSGNAYVTGYTAYQDFPTTPDAVFPKAPGAGPCGNSLCRDAFVAKLNPTGTALIYSTYLGGNSVDYANGVAVDSVGNAYVTGVTRSTNFPVTPPSTSPQTGGIFVAKLNTAGTALVYSMTLGDINSSDSGNSIALDPSKNALVTGNATAFSPTSGAYTPAVGASDGFVVKIFDSLTLFVPVVISANGLNNSFFTSELTITNRSTHDVDLDLNYVASFGGGTGQAGYHLPAGQQQIFPDAIAFLKSIGVPIPETGNRGGTLSIKFNGLSAGNEGAASVRTTTAVSNGRAGLSYPGISAGFNGPVYLCGLRHNPIDRTNVAIQNAGRPTEGEITLRLSVFPAVPDPQAPYLLPEETLSPGGFRQLSGILQSNGLGLENGFVRIERIKGNAPFYAYAVINDQASSDGSFVSPVEESYMNGRTGLTLPVVVETQTFKTELDLTNFSSSDKSLMLSYVPQSLAPPATAANLVINLRAHEQKIIPNFVDWMRQQGVGVLWPNQGSLVGPLFVTAQASNAEGIFVGGRTSAPGGGGYFGVFYSALPYGTATLNETWIYSLQQNTENRSNLGLVNTGEINSDTNFFQIEIYDGSSGTKPQRSTI
ncbi:MAG: SBBP repeat-containing protein [Terriglobia bacterium]